MASPGPWLRDPGNDDSESEGAEDFAFGSDSEALPRNHPPPTSRTAAESQAFISLNSDDEGSLLPIRAGQRGRGRRGGRSVRQDAPTGTAQEPTTPTVVDPNQPTAEETRVNAEYLHVFGVAMFLLGAWRHELRAGQFGYPS
ncbi:hypothetical protein B0H14DRAFT_2633626 [Mycena olivaceomarginata]|nr:hypothetical protein B0H14DRAFT_2633626 [Mycena olivaceomarginata]